MKILGIETSCDDTSVAVVEDGQIVHSCAVVNQEELHNRTGGVVPEVAAREHIKRILPTVHKALEEASCGWEDIGAIAATETPGLMGSLLVGMMTARTLASLHHKPYVGVHHIEGHIFANFLLPKEAYLLGTPLSPVTFPFVVLTVSGGHNEIYLVHGPAQFELLGETLDDAAGEAFDKVARVLGLGFPGGPHIARAAEQGKKDYHLPRPLLHDRTCNFSFSGLKSAVRRLVVEEEAIHGAPLPAQVVSDIAYSFENCVVDVLIEKLHLAAQKTGVSRIALSGGVSANTKLRARLLQLAEEQDYTCSFPYLPLYSTDNAAMIAGRAYFDLIAKKE